jgi:SAM-dependent methyltransferase
LDNFFDNDKKSVLEAQYEAQKIAFAPVIFQVAKAMRDLGVLQYLYDNKTGATLEDTVNETGLSKYALKVMLETSLSADIVKKQNGCYYITKTGIVLLQDRMTNVNMDFNHYVNYLGLYRLDESLREGKPLGLDALGVTTDTIYPSLSKLPLKVQKSWFDFDHFYSDSGFPEAVRILTQANPKRILDIGGNTGKFAKALVANNKEVHVTIMDLPEQVALAKQNLSGFDDASRIDFIGQNILDHSKTIPKGFDAVWVSQFLDCFDEENIIQLLQRIKAALGENGKLYIMEPLWDKQNFEASAYCIINTSPYFSAVANGYSKMFNYEDLNDYVQSAGMQIIEESHGIGIWQSICICK